MSPHRFQWSFFASHLSLGLSTPDGQPTGMRAKGMMWSGSLRRLASILYLFFGEDARPDGPKPHGLCGEQYILDRSARVLNPVVLIFARERQLHIAHDQNGRRGLLYHARVGEFVPQLVEELSVGDDHEGPGLLVDGGGGRHARSHEPFEHHHGDLFFHIVTHALAAVDNLKDCLLPAQGQTRRGFRRGCPGAVARHLGAAFLSLFGGGFLGVSMLLSQVPSLFLAHAARARVVRIMRGSRRMYHLFQPELYSSCHKGTSPMGGAEGERAGDLYCIYYKL